MEWRTIGCVALTAAALECGAATPILGGNAQLTGLTRVTLEENGAHAARFASSAKTGVLDWSKFNVGTGQSMAFDGANTTFFNLVDGAAGKSQINGLIGGSGSVWVINPNGVAFGAGAQVNVGGLFAAAAGNIKNADALRAGTATTPEFSSFAGSVETAAGSRFTADQVALLGKTVSANGSFAAAKLDIGAAGRLTVDEVSGGRVSVNVADFADDPSEIGLVLGEIAVANSDGQTGDLKAVSDRGIEVAAGGSVSADAAVDLFGFGGVSGGGSIDAAGASLSVDGGVGAISLSGTVKAKDVNLTTADYSAYGADYVHDITLSNAGNELTGVISAVGKNVSIVNGSSTMCGDITATGNLTVRAGGEISQLVGTRVMANSDGASATFQAGKDAEVVLGSDENDFSRFSARGRDVLVSESNGVVLDQVAATDGDVLIQTIGGPLEVKGAVHASGDVDLAAYDGAVQVDAGATVKADSDTSTVLVRSIGRDDAQTGCDVRVDGSVSSAGSVLLGSNTTLLDDGDQGVFPYGSGDVAISGTVTAKDRLFALSANGDVTVSARGRLSVTGADGQANLVSGMRDDANAMGNVVVDGSVTATGKGGAVLVEAANGRGSLGNMKVTGTVRATGEKGRVKLTTGGAVDAGGDMRIDGTVAATGADGKVIVFTGAVEGSIGGSATVNGTIQAGDTASVATSVHGGTGDAVVNGAISSGRLVMVSSGNGDVVVASEGRVEAIGEGGMAYLASGVYAHQQGDVRVDGNVSATEKVFLMAGVDNTASGNLRFGSTGTASSGDGVYVIVKGGGIAQTGAGVADAVDGYVDAASMHAAMSGKTVNIVVHGGSIGSGPYAYVAVDGKIYAKADGNISIAAANGGNLNGGPGVGTVSAGDLGMFTFGNPNGNSNMQAGGDLSVYTAGEIESRGLLQADGDVTASAARFGDVSFLRAGGRLAVNNVGRPSRPVVVYFTSVDGREPKILNQPNSTVIFVDGRLAGGNLQTLSRMGALEAFPVSTPELKSEQGVFGNPVFLHGDLDVANPMAVGSIDYMIQEIARLALPSDFPLDVEQSVDAAGLSPRDVYWFGQHRTVAMFR